MNQICLVLFFVTNIFVCASGVDWDVVTPLDAYVQGDDGAYEWTELATYTYDGVTAHILNMTSQFYQDASFSSQPVWWHIMIIGIPDVIRYLDAGILVIENGDNDINDPAPGHNDSIVLAVVAMANETGCVVGDLQQVPNQPIVFTNDPTQRSRTEDRIIAWTWRTYIDTPDALKDPTIILRMPMTKAGKRGLDTIYEVAKQYRPETNVTRFFVLGASKRGWTTWSLTATDRRVIAMAPMVFSLIDMNTTMMWHFQNMDGAYSFAMRPYYDENITQEFFNPDLVGVFEVEDMIYFKERYTMPILELSSSGDEFFLCDENWAWWDQIPSQNKYLMMLPNAEHSMAPHYIQLKETALSFWLNVLENVPMPTISWTMSRTNGSGSINFMTNPPPITLPVCYSAVTLSNDTRREYRLVALDENGDTVPHPVAWKKTFPVIDLGNGEYRVDAQEVPGEWVAFFIEADWEGVSLTRNNTMTFTSQVNVIPNTRPRGPCVTPADCYGYLV